jgi:cell wall-associated NlpC family hydrolase
VFGIMLIQETAGYANPTPAPGDIEVQIDQKWNALEPLLEQWNGVHDKLVANQKKVAALQAQIKPLQMQVDLAMTRVGAISAKYYEYGPGTKLNALLVSGSPATFVDELGTLNQVAKGETSTIADVVKLRNQYDAQKAPLDALVAQLSQQQSSLDTQKAQLNGQLNQLQQLRLTAYGSNAGTGSLRPAPCPYTYNGDAGSKAAKFACSQIGKPYVWAAAGPSAYDCSGITLASWRSVGVTLPHNALEQKGVTRSVSRSQLRPGDLIYYYSDVHHVAIYVGGDWQVAAPTYGEPVQMQHINTGTVNSYGRPG